MASCVFKFFTSVLLHVIYLCTASEVWKIKKGDRDIVPKSAFALDGSYQLNQFSDYPVSLPALFRLAMEENKFYMILKKISRLDPSSEEHRLIRYTRRYETEVIDAIRRWSRESKQSLNFLSILHHPFLIFQMLRRLVYEFPKVYTYLNSSGQSFQHFDPNISQWPEQNDVYFFGSLIVVLHHFYDFHIHKFGRGMFGKITTGVNLSSVHALELSRFAEKQNCYSSAVDFAAYTYDQAHRVGGMPLKTALDAYKRAIAKHDDELSLFSQTSNYGFFVTPIVSVHNFTFNRRIFVRKKTLMQHAGRSSFPEREGSTSELEEMDSHNLMSICKGENWQTVEDKSTLKCHYKIISTIVPYKLEVLSENPTIIMIYEYMQPKWSESLMNYAFGKLQVVTTPDSSGSMRKSLGTSCRISKDFPNPQLLADMELKAELITGLNIQSPENSEVFSITLHGPGGGSRPQHDSAGKYSSKKGNRYYLATLQIHLNKVEAGGRTAFHRVGLAARPEARSALFWFNHYRNGTLIDNMLHSGCPVVLGHKWVATKWILGQGNMDKYKCATNRKE